MTAEDRQQQPIVLPAGIRVNLRSPIWMSTVTTDDGRPIYADGIKVEANFDPGFDGGLKITMRVPLYDEAHGHEVQTIEGMLVEQRDYAAFQKWKHVAAAEI